MSIEQTTWRQLCAKFNADIVSADRKLPAVGSLCLSKSKYWSVSVRAGPDGLVIRRLLGPIFFHWAKIGIGWADIATVTEYASGIDKYKIAKTQSNSFVTFRNDLPLDMMIPWRNEFNQLLPDSIVYVDHMDVHWQTAIPKRFGESVIRYWCGMPHMAETSQPTLGEKI